MSEYIEQPPIREEWTVCDACKGTGEIDMCEVCEAMGRIMNRDFWCEICTYNACGIEEVVDCPECDGLGYKVHYY
ncbi:MAG: hypothetical protein ACK415_11625 [Thermodesulfovibrionales bacterium]